MNFIINVVQFCMFKIIQVSLRSFIYLLIFITKEISPFNQHKRIHTCNHRHTYARVHSSFGIIIKLSLSLGFIFILHFQFLNYKHFFDFKNVIYSFEQITLKVLVPKLYFVNVTIITFSQLRF